MMALRNRGLASFTTISHSSVTGCFPQFCTQLSVKWKLCPPVSLRACTAAQKDGAPAALKEELFKAMEEAGEVLDEKCLAAVTALEELRQVRDIAAVPHLLQGRLVGLKANFKENQVDGKQRYVGYEGSPTTLGAITLNALKPADLKITMYTRQHHVAMESPDSYVFFVDVDVLGPTGGDPLPGQISRRARFTIIGPQSMDIEFISAEIKPKFPEKDLDAWLQIFKEANPDMDEHGFVCVPHQKPIKGRFDILYMDDEIRIHRVDKRGVSVFRTLRDPE